MRVGYLLSSVAEYCKLLSPDAGPSIADEYDWPCCNPTTVAREDYDAVVIDNRHHSRQELEDLWSLISDHPGIIFLLRVNDPYVFHIHDPWYQFCTSLLGRQPIHFLTPYQPCGILSYWLANFPETQFVYAPFTYDYRQEIAVNHHERVRRIAVSGNQRRDLYPLRFSVQRASKFGFSRMLLRTERLNHPGYPEKSGLPSHQIIGAAYLQWLSRFTAAFTDSSIYRVEFLKFREIAYAGCAPIGDLPWSMFDCPKSVFFQYHSLLDLLRFQKILRDPVVTEEAALGYRAYMRHHRSRDQWRRKVFEAISRLI
jgi:hypothetical protein